MDAWAGSSFITITDIHLKVRKKIKKLGSTVNIRTVSGRKLAIAGTTRLTVQIDTSVEHVNLYATEKLATSVILGCDFFDRHVEAMLPQRLNIEMEDGSTVPIIRKPSGRQSGAPVPEEQELM